LHPLKQGTATWGVSKGGYVSHPGGTYLSLQLRKLKRLQFSFAQNENCEQVWSIQSQLVHVPVLVLLSVSGQSKHFGFVFNSPEKLQ
jgi:hypothetical protein